MRCEFDARATSADAVARRSWEWLAKMLVALSAHSFRAMQDIAPHHFLTVDCDRFPAFCQNYQERLIGRSMLVAKSIPMHIQCTVSGYLFGTLWREYRETGRARNFKLAPGLAENARLAKSIITISADSFGLDRSSDDITFVELAEQFGAPRAKSVIVIAAAVYRCAQEIAEPRGIVVAQTRLEFGYDDRGVMLIGQLLTPDSSVFWTTDGYDLPEARVSLGKHYVREFLARRCWDTRPPIPTVPNEIIAQTQASYSEALHRLTAPAP